MSSKQLVWDRVGRQLGAWLMQATGYGLTAGAFVAAVGWLLLSIGAAIIGDPWRPSGEGAFKVGMGVAIAWWSVEALGFVFRAVKAWAAHKRGIAP